MTTAGRATGAATRSRRTRAETRRLVLDAGDALLLEHGINLGAANLRYRDAFRLLEAEQDQRVTRASIHERIWDSQEDWQIDVISEIVRRNAERAQDEIYAMLDPVLAMPRTTAIERETMAAELFRISALHHCESLANDPSFYVIAEIVAAWNASDIDEDRHERLATALLSGKVRTGLETGHLRFAEFAGLEPTGAWGLDARQSARLLSVAQVTLHFSMTVRLPHDPDIATRFPGRCPDGSIREWNAQGQALWAIAHTLFRAAPDAPDSEPAPNDAGGAS